MKLHPGVILLFVLGISLPAFAQYSRPESAVFDGGVGRWLISNAGNGRILSQTVDGNITNFATNIDSPKGLTIVDDTLYVADVTRIRAYRLSTRAALYNVNVANSTSLNDVVSDGEYLYVTDMVRHRISRMSLASHQVETYVDADINSPNGLYFERENNRLILVSQRENSPIQAVNLEDGSVSTIRNTQLTELDGIARDGNGNYYISSWGSGAIYRFEADFSNQTMIAEGFDGPADIFYNQRDNILGIPVMSAHRFVLLEMPPPQAQLRVPAVVDFGEVTTGLHTEQQIVWRNAGGEDLIIDSVQHSRDGFSIAVEERMRLEPAGEIELTVAFEPVDSIEYIDTLWIFSNEPYSPSMMILTGIGLAGPALEIAERLDFGRQWAGYEVEREIELHNVGIARLTLDSGVVRRGAGFTVRLPNNRNIEPGESANATVIFSPFALGDFGETAFFYSNDPNSPTGITLTGFGARAPTLVIQAEHNFGTLFAGESAEWVANCVNSGEDTLWIDSVSVTGNYFSYAPFDPLWIAPGDTSELALIFAPEDVGEQQGVLTITTNDPTSPKRVNLRGEGRGFSVGQEKQLPREFAITEGYPSPFNSTVTFQLSLPASVPVKIDLFDAQGRAIKNVIDNHLMVAGVHAVHIDGKDLSAGTFFVRGTAGEFRFGKRVVFLK